ncbi:MAG: glycosyltransferase [Defluviitaleaceae bacterium]|nr:glycosyltransferase [Defluviitaleaceae bacterium]
MSAMNTIIDFLSETESLMDNIHNLSYDAATQLYENLDKHVKSISTPIQEQTWAQLRTEICSRQDTLLEQIIDTMPADKVWPTANIYTPSLERWRCWSDTEIMKDKCLTGYMLAKELKSTATQYFLDKEQDYPNLANVPDLNVLYGESSQDKKGDEYEEGKNEDLLFEHLQNNYDKIDALVLHGLYPPNTTVYLAQYKQMNPNGKVYLGLDMNRYWLDHWINALQKRGEASVFQFKKAFDLCDIVAASCTQMRDKINSEPLLSASCRLLPNAFFGGADGHTPNPSANKKRDIILTVGRIGTPEKNNGDLIHAFVKIMKYLPTWKVRLVGPIEPDFQADMNKLYSMYPELKKRVILTGPITNKADLYKEYDAAKIFALTSQREGGTPNVYAEALFHGCKFITSDIEAADDIIAFGALGEKYTRQNVPQLTDILIKMAKRSDKKAMEQHIPIALEYGKKHFEWGRNAKKLAYMLYPEMTAESE